MKSRIDHHVVHNLDHLAGFIEVSPQILDIAFAQSHIHSGQGFCNSERVVNLRSFALSHYDGAISNDGPILTTPERYTSPYRTTGLIAATPLGVEHIMVNAVRPLPGNRYLLSSESGSTQQNPTQWNLLDERGQVIDVLLGINARHDRTLESDPVILTAKVFLLGGQYDRNSKIFHAIDQRLLLDSVYGAGGGGGTPPDSAGPKPSLGRA